MTEPQERPWYGMNSGNSSKLDLEKARTNSGLVLPIEWAPWRKNMTVALVSALNFLVNMSATMPAPGISDMMTEFKLTSRPLATFAVSVYILGLALGPMVLAPLSEIYGRLPLYRWTNVGFVYFTVLASISWNFPLLVVLRFFQGCVASVPIVIGGGTIADLFAPEVRGRATSILFFSAMLGPPLAPIAGAFVSQYLNWRWNFGITAIMGFFLTVLSFVFLGETHEKTVIRKHNEALGEKDTKEQWRRCGIRYKSRNAKSGDPAILKTALIRPMKLLIFDRPLLLLGVYQAMSYGYILVLLTSFSEIFSGQYGFSTSVSGLPYIGIAVGFAIGVGLSSVLSDRLATRLTKKNGGVRKPEFRLPLIAWSCWVIPASLFLYGWTAFFKLHFMLPIVGASLSAIGLQLIMLNAQIYLSEAHAGHVPSAIAAVTLLRCLVGSLLPVGAASIYESLGLGWANSLLGFIGVAMMPVPWIVMIHYRTKDDEPSGH